MPGCWRSWAEGSCPCSHPSRTPWGCSLTLSQFAITLFPSQLKSQAPGSAEELRCLQALNQQLEGSSLEKLSSSQGCLKLASTIKAYVATVSLGPRGGWESSWLSLCLSFSIRLTTAVGGGNSQDGSRWEWDSSPSQRGGGGAQRQRDKEGDGGLE